MNSGDILSVAGLPVLCIVAFRSPFRGVLFWLLLSPFSTRALVSPGIAITFDRVAIPILLLATLRQGTGFRLLPDSDIPPARWLGVFILAITINCLVSFSPGPASRMLLGILDAYVLPGAVALLVAHVISSGGRIDWKSATGLLGTVTFVGVLVSVMSIVEGLTHVDLMAAEESSFTSARGGGLRLTTGFARTNGPYSQPETLGAMIMMSIFASLLYSGLRSAGIGGDSRRGGAWRRASKGLLVAGLWFNMFRSLWLGAISGLLVRTLFVPQERKRLFLLVVLVLPPALFLGDHFASSSLFQDRISNAGTFYNRVGAYKYSFRAFMENPFLGVGWDMLGRYISRAIESGDIIYTNDIPPAKSAHNVYLLVLGEFGLSGFIPFVLFLATLFSTTANCLRSATEHVERVLALGLISVFTAYSIPMLFDKLVYAKAHNGLFVFVGMAFALASSQRAAERTLSASVYSDSELARIDALEVPR